MTRTAFLTGITGFIGGKLAAHLADDGWTVHALVRKSSDAADIPGNVTTHIHTGDLARLTEILASTGPDVVFHLASLYLADHKAEQVDALVASNILLPAHLAEAMTAAGCRDLVSTGTAWQHFGTDAYNPVNLYAATKQACVDILRYYHDARGLSVVTLELFDTYGAGDKRRKLVQLLVDTAASGETLGMSPGEQIVDMTHVDDVVDAFVIAARVLADAASPVMRSYRLSGERLTVRALVHVMAEATGRPVPVKFGALPYRKREIMVPVGAGADETLPGWTRRRNLRDMLATLVRPT